MHLKKLNQAATEMMSVCEKLLTSKEGKSSELRILDQVKIAPLLVRDFDGSQMHNSKQLLLDKLLQKGIRVPPHQEDKANLSEAAILSAKIAS